MLRVRGVRKSYGNVVALAGVDLDVAAGEVCGLLGPNGAGKTTLVSIVAGLRRPDAGEVLVDGVDVRRDPSGARRRLGLAPQETGVYPSVRVRDNLVFFAELAGMRGRRAVARVDEVAEALELTALLDRQARNLSGGERRRLHTALAMLHRPSLLLLDEPTTGVDVVTRTRLLETVGRLASDDGTAVCYSTHYLPEVEALDATVAVVDQGRVVARGSVAELVAAHGDAAVELTFTGPAPVVQLRLPHERVGERLRVRTERPAEALPSVLAALGADAGRLDGIEIIRPSLETVFLAVTGRRYGEAAAAEVDLPVAEGAVVQPERAV